jgi:hypothetical protein
MSPTMSPTTKPFRGILHLLLAAAAVTGAAAAAAQPAPGERVGEVAWVERDVTGTPPGGAAAPLAANDPVLLAHEITTGERSGAGIAFAPRGALTVAADTRLVVDRDRYDQATGESESAVSVFLGKVRLFLSDAFRGSFEVDTPTATIGVKGTALVVGVGPDGTTQVWVLEGDADDVTVASKAGGSLVLEAGFTTTVAPDRAPTPPVPFDEASGVTAAVALPPPLPPVPGLPDDPPARPLVEDQPPDRGPNDDPRDPTGAPQDPP